MTYACKRLAASIYMARNGKDAVPFSRRDGAHKAPYIKDADAILAALRLTPEAAAALMDDTAVVVPREPTDEQLRALEKAGGFNLTGYLDALAAGPYSDGS